MVDEKTERLAALIRRQESMYEQLDELSRSQRGVIESGKTDALLEILGRRQDLIDQIVIASGEMEGYRATWDSIVEAMPEATRNDVKRRMDRLGVLMKAIADRDNEDRDALDKQRGDVNVGVRAVRAGGTAVRAYGAGGGAGSATPRYEDRKA